jgi:hypothetical protein
MYTCIFLKSLTAQNQVVATDILPYLSKMCEQKTQSVKKLVPMGKPQPAATTLTLGMTPSQIGWVEMIGSYSSTSSSTLHPTLGVERGSMRLTEFDNHYKSHVKSNTKFRIETMDQEVLDKLNHEALLEDDIEEWSQ